MDRIGSFVRSFNIAYENSRFSRTTANVAPFGRIKLSWKVYLGGFIFGSIMLIIGFRYFHRSAPMHRDRLEINQVFNPNACEEDTPRTRETLTTITWSSDRFQRHLILQLISPFP